MSFSSAAEINGYFSGASRAALYHTVAMTTSTMALNQKAARQRKCRMISVTKGGVRPDPVPTPAKMMPLAMPRSDEGIHLETTQFVAG